MRKQITIGVYLARYWAYKSPGEVSKDRVWSPFFSACCRTTSTAVSWCVGGRWECWRSVQDGFTNCGKL